MLRTRALVALGLGTLLAGVLLGRASAQTGHDSRPSSSRVGVAPNPARYPRSKLGAVSAAEAYSETLDKTLVSGASERRLLVDAISTSSMRDEIRQAQEPGWNYADTVLDLPKNAAAVVNLTTPIGYRVVSYTGRSARVEIWSVGVVGEPGVGHGPTASFGTATIDLAWDTGAWRLAGSPETKDGPTPVADNAQVAQELVTTTGDLRKFAHVAQ